MNGKKARELRKYAKNAIPGLPWVEYKTFTHPTKLRMTWAGPEPYEPETVELAKHCGRSWYQSMKIGYKYPWKFDK